MLTTILLVAKLSLAAGPTQLSIEIKPSGSEVLLDGKKIGKSGDKPLVRNVTPGKHEVKAVYKGDSNTEEVPVKAGEKKSYSFEFEGVDSTPEPEGKGDKNEGGDGAKAP